MIFRAPAGHILLSQKQIQILKDQLNQLHEHVNQLEEWFPTNILDSLNEMIQACNDSIQIDSEIRKKWELVKMMNEDGEDTEALENEIIKLSKKKQELSTIFERNALQ